MPNVTFVNWNRTVRAGPLANVRRIAMLAGIPLYNGLAKMANCRGAGLCGTCRVVIEPQDALTPPTFFEKKRGNQRVFTCSVDGVFGPGCRNLDGVTEVEADVEALWVKMGGKPWSVSVKKKEK